MEKKFIVPATTMLAGIITWIILLLLKGKNDDALWLELIFSIAAGSLIFFSAVRCKKAEGPLGGNIFRTILLIALAALSYFFIGGVSAVILLIAAIATTILVISNLRSKKET